MMTNTLAIRLSGGSGVFVPAEEVILYLESEGLASRTRRRIREIDEPKELDGVIAFRVHFKEAWYPFYELDVLDAIGGLCAGREVPSCV